jgi:exopolyphosphatase/guanosine-5'-triphosphate,3'-diphosphate pyrophosphatase
VATECVRRAENSRLFLDTVMQAAGIEPKVITAKHEADLARKGIQAAIPDLHSETILIDIGGGSTDFSFISSGRLLTSAGLPMGVIEPAEKFMLTDPPSETELKSMQSWAESMIAAHTRLFPKSESPHPASIIATAGTATTLAAMDLELIDYDPARVNGYVLSLDALNKLLEAMVSVPLVQRRRMPGLEPGRALVIIPGALILKQLMRHFGTTACTVSDAGLLEGIILNHASLKKLIEKT